ncbi:hypothetical protein ACVBEJ_06510 [Porticoccus sp. GXU_MW_L64]
MFRKTTTESQHTPVNSHSDSAANVQQSQLFATLTERLEPEQPLSVLDVGPGVAATLDFFSAYRCRLQFADLFDLLPLPVVDEGLTEDQKQQQLQQYFTRALALPEGRCFDLLLFWDLFNYLDNSALAALSQALQPHVHSGTRGHGFVQRDRQKTPSDYRYGVASESSFTLQPGSRQGLQRHCHAQAVVERQLQAFTIQRGVLMLDGRLEFVLHRV